MNKRTETREGLVRLRLVRRRLPALPRARPEFREGGNFEDNERGGRGLVAGAQGRGPGQPPVPGRPHTQPPVSTQVRLNSLFYCFQGFHKVR